MGFYSMWMICFCSRLQTQLCYENDEMNDIWINSRIHINIERKFFGGRKSNLKHFFENFEKYNFEIVKIIKQIKLERNWNVC